MTRRMIARLILLGLAVVFAVVYVKGFERRNIFFPTKEIDYLPGEFGLNYEDVYFSTSDGLKLNGWFMPAKDPRATLLFCHGNAGNISHRLEVVELFNKLDLNVFIFDYRGYGKSPGRPSEKGTYLDALAAYNYLVSRKDVDKDRILAYGKSLGGAVAIELATKVEVCAAIVESTFTSTIDMGKEIYPFLPLKFIVTMDYDAISKIGRIAAPKLIIHSKDDEVVPLYMGQRLFQAASEPKEFYQMHMGGHNEALFMAKDEFRKRIDEFLNKYGIN